MKLRLIFSSVIFLIFSSMTYAAPVAIQGYIPEKDSGCFMGKVAFVKNYEAIPYRVTYRVSYTKPGNQVIQWSQQVDVAPFEQVLVGCISVQEYPDRYNASYLVVSSTKL